MCSAVKELWRVQQGHGQAFARGACSAGKLLNAAKQALEAAFEAKKQDSTGSAGRQLDAEWVELTLPRLGLRREVFIRDADPA